MLKMFDIPNEKYKLADAEHVFKKGYLTRYHEIHYYLITIPVQTQVSLLSILNHYTITYN